MLKSYKEVMGIYRKNIGLLFVNLMIYTIICGQFIFQMIDIPIHASEFCLLMVTNHYYILYGLYPIILMIIIRKLKNISDCEFIRYQNSFFFVRHKTYIFTLWLTSYMIIQAIIAQIIGLVYYGLNTEATKFSMISESGIRDILINYHQVFDNTYLSIIAILIYFIFGFTLVFSIMTSILMKKGTKFTLLSCVILYLSAYVGFISELKTSLPLLCFNNYTIMHHALFVNRPIVFIEIIVVGCIILFTNIGVIHPVHWRKKKEAIDLLDFPRVIFIVSYLVIIFMFFFEWILAHYSGDINLRDMLLNLICGTTSSHFSFMNWVKMVILYGTPIFMIGVYSSRLSRKNIEHYIIRHKNYRIINRSMLMKKTKYLVLYLVFFLGLANIFYFIGSPSEFNTIFLFTDYGHTFDVNTWTAFMAIFSINLMFLFFIFEIMCRYFNVTSAFIILILWAYLSQYMQLSFALPGLLNIIEISHYKQYHIILSLMIIFIGFFYYTNFRRMNNGNHIIRKCE